MYNPIRHRYISQTREQAIEQWGADIAGGEEFTLALPKVFYFDHIDRGCSTGVFIDENKNVIKLSMTRGEIMDLLSDADYYSDPVTASEMGLRDIYQSAKRTITSIGKQIEIERVRTGYFYRWQIVEKEVAA